MAFDPAEFDSADGKYLYRLRIDYKAGDVQAIQVDPKDYTAGDDIQGIYSQGDTPDEALQQFVRSGDVTQVLAVGEVFLLESACTEYYTGDVDLENDKILMSKMRALQALRKRILNPAPAVEQVYRLSLAANFTEIKPTDIKAVTAADKDIDPLLFISEMSGANSDEALAVFVESGRAQTRLKDLQEELKTFKNVHDIVSDLHHDVGDPDRPQAAMAVYIERTQQKIDVLKGMHNVPQ